jgi:hypothetical protein
MSVCGAEIRHLYWRWCASLVGQIRSDFDQRNADDNSPQHKNGLRRKIDFANAFNAIPPVQPSRENIPLSVFPKLM